MLTPIALLRKAVLPLYRVFSLISLYAILLSIVSYGAIFVFYAASSSWVVPFIVNSSDTTVLALDGQLTTSQQALNALVLNKEQETQTLALTHTQIAQLSALDRELTSTLKEQRQTWSVSAGSLDDLHSQKTTDNAMLTGDVSRTNTLKAIIEKNLAAGLITKGDAQAQIIQLDQFTASTTDSKVAETLLTDTVRQHQMTDLNFLTVLGQKVQLEAQIGTLNTTVVTTESQLKQDTDTANTITKAIDTAKASPYFEVINSDKKLHLAVVPYNSRSTVKVGDPLYDCLLGIAICRRAGTVVAVYPNEEMFEHPILRINMRGYIIKIDADAKALTSKTLAVGSKPLFF